MKIYVVTHKKVEELFPKDYECIQVGAAFNNKFCELTDNTGDNISKKNPYYCELTAAYWVWKNDNENDIVGLMHYRRFLTRNVFSSSQKWYLDNNKVNKLLKKYDFIATKNIKGWLSIKELLSDSVSEKDFNLLKSVISNYFPDYLNAFDKVFNGKKTRLCNICICKKQRWDEYYEWLFSVFDEMEKVVDMSGYSEQEKRLYGYLSERLMSVYFIKNGFKVKGYPIRIVGVSLSSRIKRKIKKLLHIGK